MKVLSIGAIVIVAPCCLAQYDAFPDVPKNHWVYETLYTLQREKAVNLPLSIFKGWAAR